MGRALSLDGRTLVAVSNSPEGTVGGDTRFHLEQDADRLYGHYAGGSVVDGHLVGTFDGRAWDVRYVQLHEDGTTATGHSVGVVTILEDGRVRVEDDWEWESRPGSGSSVLEETEAES